ncbi:CoxG family protein [Natrarchaeobius oligotrophus]|uniref:Carbon monoxide dehydrogenase n=1 Tax=Natrarchaeobius chitinivorans TaxID=1679083 RepID=A0A3N6MSX9_NATCH|nr:SRPBCC domain-containing protein [Natrarchaeobius chitinivorans]RQG99441.1 carbon monoxide dehydrogenase [Natrarchaeobius chitinivorans]
MEFNGSFELEDVSIEEAWLALSDPRMIEAALPGCQFLVQVDGDDPDFDELAAQADDGPDEEDLLPNADPEVVAERAFEDGGQYAALIELGVGSVKPSFETIVTITDREFPVMNAAGEGSASDSSFEMESGMELHETETGVRIDWWTETDVFGRLARMGQRLITPVANRVVNRFFSDLESRLQPESDESQSDGYRNRVRSLFK